VEERLEKQIRQLYDAVQNLRESLELDLERYDEVARDSIKSGQVQKFEFCIEVYWKTLRRLIIEQHGEDTKSPKGAIKKGFELGMFSYPVYETTLAMINWRNELSHMYKKEMFEATRKRIIENREVWKELLRALRYPNP